MPENLPSIQELFPDLVRSSNRLSAVPVSQQRSVQDVSHRPTTISAPPNPISATPRTRSDPLLSYSQSTYNATNLQLLTYNDRYPQSGPHQAYSATSPYSHTPQPFIPLYSTRSSSRYPSPVRLTPISRSTSAPQSPILPINPLYHNPASTSRSSRSLEALLTSGVPGSPYSLTSSTEDLYDNSQQSEGATTSNSTPSFPIAAVDFIGSTSATHSQDDKKKGKHRCSYCGKRCPRPSGLKIHMVKHTGDKPFKCDKCDQTFGIKSNCSRHMRTQHPETAPDESNSEDVRRKGNIRFIDEGLRFQRH